MRHIKKTPETSEVKEYEDELKKGKFDKEHLSDPLVHPSMKGPDVYDAVKSFGSFERLKDRMFSDQGGICCYCGCRLQYPTHPQYIVEHVFPKEKDRTLAGEYENLLLSCRPTAAEENSRKAAPKKERNLFFHCDKSKGSSVIPITPLQEDCQIHFIYDEFGGIQGDNEDAQKDIDILNLNCEWLQKRRNAAIEGAIYDENYDLLPDEELKKYLATIMCTDANGRHSEFCFVIKNVIEGLLKTETDFEEYLQLFNLKLKGWKNLKKVRRFSRKQLKMLRKQNATTKKDKGKQSKIGS